jgi:hypothetical protein
VGSHGDRRSLGAANSVQLSHDITNGALLAHDYRVQIATRWANIVNCLLINFGFFPDCRDPRGNMGIGDCAWLCAATNSVQSYHSITRGVRNIGRRGVTKVYFKGRPWTPSGPYGKGYPQTS